MKRENLDDGGKRFGNLESQVAIVNKNLVSLFQIEQSKPVTGQSILDTISASPALSPVES